MKELTAENVDAVFMDCLFAEGEDTSNPVITNGILHNFGFHRGRLMGHKQEIAELLNGLPEDFRADKGGGWSFLNACMTKTGRQWGEHRNVEQLLVLGIATEQATILLPREVWKTLPGGMPYFSIKTEPDAPALVVKFGKVFDLLVSIGGAPESMRQDFLLHHTTSDPTDEYRFQGKFGFGGKYRRKTNRVDCYSEDENEERLKIIERLNAELAKLS